MTTPAGERRIVSVLVADVVGSTAIAEKLGPERSKFVFDDIVRLMREEVERFGGTVAQLTGDGVLALFGAPIANEDDPERAVRAGLAIRQATARYGEEIGTAYGIDLAARVAVNTGPVVVPGTHEAPDRLYNALGDTVNVAARLQTLGDLVVGPETARQVRGSFRLEELGAFALKGKTAAVAVARVLEELETSHPTPTTPLVGREDELALLADTFEALRAGKGAIVVITGEPGVGKSRLKSEIRDRFGERVRFLEGNAVSYASDIPYWPIRELLRDWLGLGSSEPEARVRLELRAALAAALPDQAEDTYPFLANVLGLPLGPEKGLHELSRDSVQQQTFEALYSLARALAGEQPLCLVFDDIHWADEATLAAIEALLPIADEHPIAFALSYRAEGEHGGWDLADRARRRFRHRFSQIDLQPLETSAALQLAEEAAGAELPGSVASHLAERSGGNPFFLEEALHDLLDRGVLRRTNGSVEFVAGGDVAVPALVEETLQARLDRLEAATREVVSVASVVGRTFDLPLLEQIVPSERLRPALSELQRLDLVVEERRLPAPEYRFRHGLVQEVAYRGLLGPRRRDLHRAVGEALERLYHDSEAEVLGLLARHYSEAHDVARAVEYLLKAANAARAANADEEAHALYAQALEFLDRAGDEVRARETLLTIALMHHLASDFERAGAAYHDAFLRSTPAPQQLVPTERISSTTYQPRSLAPGHGYAENDWELCRHVFRGLVAIDREYQIVPDLAASFTVSGDGLTYRFRLRPDVVWSDGVRLSAADFEFTYAQMRKDEAPTAFLLERLRTAEAIDDYTLELHLEEPSSYFLYLLGQPAFFPWPPHVRERKGRGWHQEGALVGNGPFVAVERTEERLVFAASRSWTGARGNIGEVFYDLRDDADWPGEQWDTGRYAAVPIAPPHVRPDARDTVLETSSGMATTYLAFVSTRPPFDDVRVRRAVAHALDRGPLAVGADASTEGGVVPPAMPGHSHRVAPRYDQNEARRLLAYAGHPNGRGLPAIMLAEATGYYHAIAEQIAEQLAEVGIQVSIERTPIRDFREFVAARANIAIEGWIADYPDPSGMLETPLQEQPYLYHDDALIGRLARARTLRNGDDRLRAYREFERLWIGEHVAVVPLCHNRRVTWRRSWLSGMWVSAITRATFADAVVTRPEREIQS
jgi:ABC-type transport system substrate-binding protein/class 3 adenylate cyclase